MAAVLWMHTLPQRLRAVPLRLRLPVALQVYVQVPVRLCQWTPTRLRVGSECFRARWLRIVPLS